MIFCGYRPRNLFLVYQSCYRQRSAAGQTTLGSSDALLIQSIYRLCYTRCCTQTQILQSRVLNIVDSYCPAENRVVKVADIRCCTSCCWPSAALVLLISRIQFSLRHSKVIQINMFTFFCRQPVLDLPAPEGSKCQRLSWPAWLVTTERVFPWTEISAQVSSCMSYCTHLEPARRCAGM